MVQFVGAINKSIPVDSRSQNLVLNWCVFIISPILGTLFAIPMVRRRKYAYTYILGAAFAVFGAFLPPTSDAYRYRIEMLSATTLDIDFDTLWITNKDFLYWVLSYIFNQFNSTFEVFKLVLFIGCYSLYIWMYHDIVKQVDVLRKSRKFYLLGLVGILFSIRLFTLAVGIRFGLASTIVTIAMYLLYKHELVKGLLLYIVSATLHFSMLMFAPCIIMAVLLKRITLARYVKFAIIVGLIVFSSSAIGTILTSLLGDNELVTRNVDAYVNGKWGTESIMSTASFGGLMFSLLRILPVLPLTWFETTKSKSFISNLGFMLVLVLCISFSSITLLLRYSNVTAAILFVSFLLSLKDSRKCLNRLKLVTYGFIMVFFVYVYSQRDILANSHLEYMVMISPISLLEEHTYTESWIQQNIDSEGELK